MPRLRRSHQRPVNGHTARSGNLAKVNDQNAGLILTPRLVARYRKVLRAARPGGLSRLLAGMGHPAGFGAFVARKRDAAQALEFRRWLCLVGHGRAHRCTDSTIIEKASRPRHATRRQYPHLVGKLNSKRTAVARAAEGARRALTGRRELAKLRRRSTKKEVSR